MNLSIKHFVIIITITFISCVDKPQHLTKIKATQIAVSPKLDTNDSIANYITPFRNRINTILDSTLAFVTNDLVKDDGDRNTSAGNFLADVVLEQGNPIFNSRTNKEIDFVVLNHGGIRSIVSRGDVNARTAYQIMPFENNIVVVEMTGTSVKDMLSFLAKSGRAHPVANTKLVLDNQNNYLKTEINGRSFDENKTYYVATNDYLVQGGDDMGFFKNRTSTTNLDYLVRNAIIDYFKKVDTITATVDDRFIQLK
jgi:2',3'-cyclic-nucleotide 2'-phosphodiesterase (5'-nucleotidase family)